jgi:hypothetical protein
LVSIQQTTVSKSSIFWYVVCYNSDPCLQPTLCWFLAWLVLQPWRWSQHDPLKRWLNFNELHGVLYQKTKLFITTAARTSNPAHGGTSRKRLTFILTALDILRSQQNQSSVITKKRNLGVKCGRRVGLTTLPPSISRLSK